ncbi:hypothetical protein COOONC_12299, partial [Cooperia oncophora]
VDIFAYVAAKDANPRKEISGGGTFENIELPQRKKSSTSEVPCELKLESGRHIRYVAAKDANPRKEISGGGTFENIELPQRKKSSTSEGVDQSVLWEGVNTLCQVMDAIVESEMETDFFEGKDVLEIGFATGLPSVYAYENGAAEVVLHSSVSHYFYS